MEYSVNILSNLACAQVGHVPAALEALEQDMAALRDSAAQKSSQVRELQTQMSLVKMEKLELEAAAKSAIQQVGIFGDAGAVHATSLVSR